MKRYISISLVALMLLFGITGCGDDEASTDSKDDKINVVATNFPAYDFMKEIGGDKINLTMLIPPGTETHSYEPSPKDIKAVESSDIFAYTGGESDVWVDEIVESFDSKEINSVKMMDLTDVVTEEITPGMEEDEHEHEHEDEHEGEAEDEEHEEEYDEHVWTSPVNAKAIAKGFADSLIKADDANKDYYEGNRASYEKQLDELDQKFKDAVNSGSRKTIIVGDRFPFRYLADEYDLTYFAAFPGCSTESDASPSTISFLIDKTKEEKIPVVFTIELSTGKIADTICDATGAKKLVLNSCHNVTQDQFDENASYISLMNENVQNLKEALK